MSSIISLICQQVSQQIQRPSCPAIGRTGAGQGLQAGLALAVQFPGQRLSCSLRSRIPSKPSSTQRRYTLSTVAAPTFGDRAISWSLMPPVLILAAEQQYAGMSLTVCPLPLDTSP